MSDGLSWTAHSQSEPWKEGPEKRPWVWKGIPIFSIFPELWQLKERSLSLEKENFLADHGEYLSFIWRALSRAYKNIPQRLKIFSNRGCCKNSFCLVEFQMQIILYRKNSVCVLKNVFTWLNRIIKSNVMFEVENIFILLRLCWFYYGTSIPLHFWHCQLLLLFFVITLLHCTVVFL